MSTQQTPTLLGRVGQWAIANVYMATPWTSEEQAIRFESRDVHVLPQWKDRFPSLVVAKSPTTSMPREWSFLSRFLSCLVWATQGRAAVHDFGGGTRVSPMKGFDRVARDFIPYHKARFPFSSLVTPDDRQALGLAYWRQGGAMSYPEGGYAFLSYFKIVESQFVDGKDRGKWIDRTLPRIEAAPIPAAANHAPALEAMARLTSSGEDVGTFLYDTGRNATAHGDRGEGRPVTNPDDFSHHLRMRLSTPIMQCLAYMALTEELGLPRPEDMGSR